MSAGPRIFPHTPLLGITGLEGPGGLEKQLEGAEEVVAPLESGLGSRKARGAQVCVSHIDTALFPSPSACQLCGPRSGPRFVLRSCPPGVAPSSCWLTSPATSSPPSRPCCLSMCLSKEPRRPPVPTWVPRSGEAHPRSETPARVVQTGKPTPSSEAAGHELPAPPPIPRHLQARAGATTFARSQLLRPAASCCEPHDPAHPSRPSVLQDRALAQGLSKCKSQSGLFRDPQPASGTHLLLPWVTMDGREGLVYLQ